MHSNPLTLQSRPPRPGGQSILSVLAMWARTPMSPPITNKSNVVQLSRKNFHQPSIMRNRPSTRLLIFKCRKLIDPVLNCTTFSSKSRIEIVGRSGNSRLINSFTISPRAQGKTQRAFCYQRRQVLRLILLSRGWLKKLEGAATQPCIDISINKVKQAQLLCMLSKYTSQG